MKVTKALVSVLILSLFISTANAMTFTVTNSANAGKGTLRDAINTVLTSTPPNRITFNLPSPYTISLTSELSNLTATVSMEGSTQPGYAGTPIVKLASIRQTNGLVIGAANCLVRGLILTGFVGNAISIGMGGSNQIENCHLLGNNTAVWISGSGANVIGGLADSNRNVISGNLNAGVYIYGTSAGGNSVLGNYIGVNPTDLTKALRNTAGIIIYDSSSNRIAGIASGPQVISGNGNVGIQIDGDNARRNVLVKNHIGTDSGGVIAVTNPVGVQIFSPMNIVGGTNASDRNLISANWSKGIHLSGANAWSNSVLGNYIGVNESGTAQLGNQDYGIVIENASNNVIGALKAGSANVLSGNQQAGLQILGASARGNQVQGNTIGGSPSGAQAVSNAYCGVLVQAPGNVIGDVNQIIGNVLYGIVLTGTQTVDNVVQGNYIGVNTNRVAVRNRGSGVYVEANRNTIGPGNYIAGNNVHGIWLYYAHDTRVLGNLIGNTGLQAVSNGYCGIYAQGGDNNFIGGAGVGDGNTIAGNGRRQVEFYFGVSNQVQGNYLGLAADGLSRITNGLYFEGIGATYFQDLVIGGTNPAARNVISGLGSDGLGLYYGNGGRILGNYIGLSRYGDAAVTNAGIGLYMVNCSNLVIGQAGARNIISGNSSGGLRLDLCCSNLVADNYIGFAADGLAQVANGGFGIHLAQSTNITVRGNWIAAHMIGLGLYQNSRNNQILGNTIGLNLAGQPAYTGMTWGININDSSSNRIGGASAADRNVIRGAVIDISITDATSVGNVIQGNFLGVKADGVTSSGSGSRGVDLSDARQTRLGGTAPGEGNVIAYHSTEGVYIWSFAEDNSVLGNSIYSNRIGISIGPFANHNMPAPYLTNAISYYGSSRLQGYLAGVTSKTCRVEFFFNDQTNGAGGKVFVGATNVVTDASGLGRFSILLAHYGSGIVSASATATDPNGNTSMFSDRPSALPVGFDTDNDKMPDFWELQYGLNPNVSNPPTADADSDLVYDYQEYVAGTLPNQAASCLSVEVLSRSGSSLQIMFPSILGRTYAVDQTMPPAPPLTNPWTWAAVSNGLVGTGGDLSCIATSNIPYLWYRVRVQMP